VEEAFTGIIGIETSQGSGTLHQDWRVLWERGRAPREQRWGFSLATKTEALWKRVFSKRRENKRKFKGENGPGAGEEKKKVVIRRNNKDKRRGSRQQYLQGEGIPGNREIGGRDSSSRLRNPSSRGTGDEYKLNAWWNKGTFYWG